jgi:hypothetical protein
VYRFQSTTSASPHWERTCMYASPR